jgi:hypothetical protein
VALGQVFSEYFGFPCQSSFHRLLHIHHHRSSGAGTIGQLWPTYQVDSVHPPRKTKKKTRVINYGIVFLYDARRKSPRYSLDRRLGGPQNRSGRCGVEKHLAPVGNPTPAVQPVARRDATDTGVKRMECTPLHIYFPLEFFFNCFIYACLPLTTSSFCNSG